VFINILQNCKLSTPLGVGAWHYYRNMVKKTQTSYFVKNLRNNKDTIFDMNISSKNNTLLKQTGLKRDIIDKFYTIPNVAHLCIETLINEHIIDPNLDLVIEPSSGDGSFFHMKTVFRNTEFYDIKPEHSSIKEQDFLTLIIDDDRKFSKIHVVGNPPFGRQSSLAKKFIKKASSFCYSISFILPNSFKKDSMKSVFPRNFILQKEIQLEDNSFVCNGIPYNVPCVFQIWVKSIINRTTTQVQVPLCFTFVKKTESPTISFRRIGVNAGVIQKNIDSQSEQSHYFIKIDGLTDSELTSLRSHSYEINNTVGPKSISKPEVIQAFNSILQSTRC
jgi:hypothetical protein